MKNTYNIRDFLKMYYHDSNIPAYLYENGTFVFCVPEQTPLTFPPKKYLDILLASDKRISYCSTEYGIYYGCLHLEYNTPSFLVFGPMGNIPFSDTELHQMYADYVVPADQHTYFQNFTGNIPQMTLSALLAKLLFLNYCLHGEILSDQDLLPNDAYPFFDPAYMTEENYQKKEDFLHNRSYELETILTNLVRSGKTEEAAKFRINDTHFHTGIVAPTALRQLKNNIIITTTLCTRAAIEGGLDYDTAYQLSDQIIQTAEQIQSADRLYDLLLKICYIFTQKVYEAKLPAANGCIQKAIRFIQQNTNTHITVDDVADHVGFSRSYFSAYFKNELGFSIGAFIQRCKLEEGRRLLQYTDKTISVISNYLCFSSQSHFQTAFKKQFGITPLQYRRGK